MPLQYECFISLSYDSELTYEEVQEREAELQPRLQDILDAVDALHIDFRAINDSLQIQCVFAQWDDPAFQILCADIARLTVQGVHGRLVVVNQDLDAIFLAILAEGHPQMAMLSLSMPHSKATFHFKTSSVKNFSEAEIAKAKADRMPPPPPPQPEKKPVPQEQPDPLLQQVGNITDPEMLLAAWRHQMRRRFG